MTADVILFETNSATGQVVETRLTGADAEAWRAARGLSTEEQLQNLREKRNQLLAETDYLALADATLSEDMRTYRQALRDLPANTSDPANPTWPVKPS
jgi:hypothetical protein